MSAPKKQRLIVPFPAAQKPTASVQVADKVLCNGRDCRKQQDTELEDKSIVENKKAVSNKLDIFTLQSFLPQNHLPSLQLADQVESIVAEGLPAHISAVEVVRPGLVEFVIQLESDPATYGCCAWRFQVGGAPADDSLPRALVAARFVSQLAHPFVDDAGFVDKNFWNIIFDRLETPLPSLHIIMRTVVHILQAAPSTPISQDDAAEDLELMAENARRREQWEEARQYTCRKANVILTYASLARHPVLLAADWPLEAWLCPSFMHLLNAIPGSSSISAISATGTSDSSGAGQDPEPRWRDFVTENSPGVFSFELFTSAFCDLFVEEMDCFEGSDLPRRRPNTMNSSGLIVNEMGLHPLMSALLSKYLAPIAELLYPTEPVSVGLDHHHSFLVQYNSAQAGVDRGLDMHSDASEVTVNVSLGRDGFNGGDLCFCGDSGKRDHRKYRYSYRHVKGRAVMHLGRMRHGAEDVVAKHKPVDKIDEDAIPTTAAQADSEESESERLNLIIWLRSSVFRSAVAFGHIAPDMFPREAEDPNSPPDKCCLSKYNDDDYEEQLARFKI
jgi:hypothetical protein